MAEPLPFDAVAVLSADQLSTRPGDEIVIFGLRDSVYYGLSDVGARIWYELPESLAALYVALRMIRLTVNAARGRMTG